jgi:hypothetical protein
MDLLKDVFEAFSKKNDINEKSDRNPSTKLMITSEEDQTLGSLENFPD